jgi:hypothetical protein
LLIHLNESFVFNDHSQLIAVGGLVALHSQIEVMKAVIGVVISLISFCLQAQNVGIGAGHSLYPADHIALRYEHWTNGNMNLALSGFMERSRRNLLRYGCYGLDMLAEYANSAAADPLPVFALRFGMGATLQFVSEPWLYKGLSFFQRMNYGIVAETSIEWNATEVFRIGVFCQQKFLLRNTVGRSRGCFGLGLMYRLSQ